MARTRLFSLAACAVALAVSCSRGDRAAGASGAEPLAFTDVAAAHAAFLTAERHLAALEGRGGAADAAALETARQRYDAAYQQDQRTLATYLTLAVNQRPEAEETREALRLYGESALANARRLLDGGGDPARAVRLLEAAERPFRAVGAALPAGWASVLADARRRQGAPPAAPAPGPTGAD
jgi:hypothetical protein